jgi:hypothetical protein
VWTPRRVLLLLAGTLAFAGVYAAYTVVLGTVDGLPQLPARSLLRGDGTFRPPDRPVLPTVQMLRDAFGPNCAEQNTTVYANQLTFKNGDSWVVVATGRLPNPDENKVTLSPFSVAVFGKPTPDHLLAPGQARQEVSTFHADKAVVVFDRPVAGLPDMQKAKIVRLELVSDPEADPTDDRRGRVHVTNNQRAADPNQALVLRTTGPLVYRDPKSAGPRAAGPDVWTDAAVEVVDKQNLPRGLGEPAPPTAPARGDDLRAAGVVADVLAARRLPPPTVTAVGMKVYLADDREKEKAKKGSAGFSGVRRIELGEKVLLNLWVDSRQGVVASPAGGGTAGSPLGVRDEPAAGAAVLGGLYTAAQTIRRLDRALVQVETLGAFAYDAVTNVARFDVVPQADPTVPNDVQVHRIPPRGGAQRLFSQVLEVEFHGPPTGATAADPKPPAAGQPPRPAGPTFKQLHAWTSTPGRYLTVSSDADQLNAFGFDLVHDQGKNESVLKGAPLFAVRSNLPRADGKPAGGNELTAGAAGRPATLTMTTTTTPTPAGPVKSTTAVIAGAGTMKLFDPNSGANTIGAAWSQSLTHTKETVQAKQLELLTFTGAAGFEDQKADFWLKGNVLKLWMDGAAADPDRPSGGQPLPHRVQALGDVSSHSADFDIEHSDHLNVYFEEGTFRPAQQPPAAQPAAAPPRPALQQPVIQQAAARQPVAAPEPPAKKAEPPPKPPAKIRARTIDTWVVREPVKSDFDGLDRPGSKMPGLSPADPATKPVAAGTRYHLRKARCEGSETVNGQVAPLVHQDKTDPTKPRGLDIYGAVLHLDQAWDGGKMTVFGEPGRPGQVHHEGMSVVGPKVEIDQLRNRMEVEGGGSLAMPAGGSLTGADPGKKADPAKKGAELPPPPIVVHWRDGMKFEGALKWAEFIGRVRATQGESSVVCHSMQVHFDRPVAFNPARRPDPKAGAKDAPAPGGRADAKVEKVMCYAAPADAPDEPRGARWVEYTEVARDPATGAVAKWQFMRATELEVFARMTDPSAKEPIPYQQVVGTGPGEVRIWQLGDKDVTRAPGPPPAGGAAAQKDGEMKLTVVTFAGRMVAKDKGRVYQEATFFSLEKGAAPIEVVHAAAREPGADIPRANPPPGTVRLQCADKLVVSTSRPEAGPAAQRMDAYGNVFVLTDRYDGWGETVNSDARYVTLLGGGPALARITHRFNGTSNSGRRIVYDRTTGDFQVEGSAGATIQNPGR